MILTTSARTIGVMETSCIRITALGAVAVAGLLVTACGSDADDRTAAAGDLPTDATAPDVSVPDVQRTIPSSLPTPSSSIVPPSSSVDGPDSVPEPTQVGRGQGGPGTLTVELSEPVAVEGFVDSGISCEVDGNTYVAAGSDLAFQGYVAEIEIRVQRYTGPGDHRAIVSLSLTEPDGTSTGGEVPGVPVTIEDLGGSISVDVTAESGQRIVGSIDWTCG